MTVAPARGSGTRGRVRTLGPGDERLLQPLVAADPVANCFVAARLRDGGLRPTTLGGDVLGYESDGRLLSAMYVGANMIPIGTDDAARAEFVRHCVRTGRRSSSIVGPAAEVLPLWSLLRPYWGAARDVRPEQPLMVASEPPLVPPDPQVRRSRPAELEVIFPACVAMFLEEVGVSPTAGGAGPAYRRRVADLIAAGRSYARFEGGLPVFKAEIGAMTPQVCQVQGVWVDPQRRGHGLAAAGMAAVVALASRESAAVSLYVNSFNIAAVSAYTTAGFRQVGTFATVLF